MEELGSVFESKACPLLQSLIVSKEFYVFWLELVFLFLTRVPVGLYSIATNVPNGVVGYVECLRYVFIGNILGRVILGVSTSISD